MSDLHHETKPSSRAVQIEEQAAEWLMSRRDPKSWTEDNESQLNAWLEQSSVHKVAFFRLEAALERSERLRALRPSAQRPARMWPPVLKVATAFSIVAVIGIAAGAYVFEPHATAYRTSVGNREVLSLNDGSQIELNTDSLLRLSQSTSERRAWLDKGEAYFQIKHDARRPFTVTAGNATVVDLGTKFVLRRFSDRLEVTLLDGSAQVETADKTHSAVLKPGDVAIARLESISVTRKSTQQLADEIGWRRGVLMFRYTTLAQAAAEFNRYNNTKIVIDDPRIAKFTIYGAFASNDVAAFADAAQTYFKLHIQNRDGQIVLSR